MGIKVFFYMDNRELLDEIEVGDKVKIEFIKTRGSRFVVAGI